MNKTDALLSIERIREAIRLLPDDADIFGFENCYDSDCREHMTDIHLIKPVKWPEVLDGREYRDWASKIIQITPFVRGWWGVDVDRGEKYGEDF